MNQDYGKNIKSSKGTEKSPIQPSSPSQIDGRSQYTNNVGNNQFKN